MREEASANRRCAIVIIGDRETGKSSIIRALTGTGTVRGPPVYHLRDRYGNVRRFLVLHTSPQENGVAPQRFINTHPYDSITTVPHDALVIGLEMTYRWNAQLYIDILRQLDYEVRVALTQDPDRQLMSYLTTNDIAYIVCPYRQGNTFADPFEVASYIRRSIWPP